MAIRIVRLGTPRTLDEGPRFGTVRRPPRGVRKEDYGRRDFFDLWLPDLAPSTPLQSYAKSGPLTANRWRVFSRRYLAEMGKPAPRRLLATLAALSSQANFALGCYCDDESRCHRSLLRQLLTDAGATVLPG
jgi:uncharacterized protein YeaO (DUF488 family)